LWGRLRDRRDRLLYPAAASGPEQWQRVAMNQAVDAHLASLGPPRCAAAEISGENHAAKPWKEYVSLAFPDFDLCSEPSEDRRFDVVICEQVIEHVVDPCMAAANLRRLCVPGGHIVVSTPFLVKVHELPAYGMLDYWRFTPRGLQLLLEHAGLQVDTVGSWGNRQCVVGNLGGWSSHRPWHSLRDEPDLPIQVWAFARNTGAAGR
jgi:SAM-dependent methyltransferase